MANRRCSSAAMSPIRATVAPIRKAERFANGRVWSGEPARSGRENAGTLGR